MDFLLGLVLGVLSLEGCFSAVPNSEKVVALSGGNAILPCSLNTPDSDDLPTVEWSKEGLKPNVVFLYRNGFETFEMKNAAFEFRTSLFMREVKNGNVSLRISDLRTSDGGTYQCLIIHGNGTREATVVQLVVAAVSDPRLSVASVENRRVTMACEASCWLPAPLMVILDEKGNNITDTVETRGAESTECFIVRQTATVPSHTHRVFCRVEQQQTNQSRTAEILLSDQWRSSTYRNAAFSVGVIASVCFFGFCVVCIWWTCSKYAKRKQRAQRILSVHELTDVTCEGAHLLQAATLSVTDGAENTANQMIVNLRKEVADLRSENRKKDETILKLWGKIQSVAGVSRLNGPRRSLPFLLDFRSSDHNTENRELLINGPTQQGPFNHPGPVNLSEKNSLKAKVQTQSSNVGPGRGKNGRFIHRSLSLGVPPSSHYRNGYIPLLQVPEQ